MVTMTLFTKKTHEYDSKTFTQRLKGTIETFNTPTETGNNHDFEGS